MNVLALALALLPSAHAVIYGGNPGLTIDAVRVPNDLTEGSVDLAKVRMHACAGGFTDVTVDDTIDPVASHTVAVPAGNWCGVTLYWDSSMILEGNSPAGPYTLAYDEPTTYFALATPIPLVYLTPYEVVTGVIYGGNPGIQLTIQ